jgi:hypothetical protein
MKLELNGKIFAAPRPKTKLYRKALLMRESIDMENFNVETLDELVEFVVEVFNHQFTIDDIYEYQEPDETMDTCVECLHYVAGGKEQEDNKKKAIKGSRKTQKSS